MQILQKILHSPRMNTRIMDCSVVPTSSSSSSSSTNDAPFQFIPCNIAGQVLRETHSRNRICHRARTTAAQPSYIKAPATRFQRFYGRGPIAIFVYAYPNDSYSVIHSTLCPYQGILRFNDKEVNTTSIDFLCGLQAVCRYEPRSRQDIMQEIYMLGAYGFKQVPNRLDI